MTNSSISDQNGCIVTQTGIVLNPGPVCCSIVVVDNIINAPCFGDNATVTVTPSNTKVLFHINGMKVLQMAQVKMTYCYGTAGNYYVTITDDLCSINHQVTLTEPSQVTLPIRKLTIHVQILMVKLPSLLVEVQLLNLVLIMG